MTDRFQQRLYIRISIGQQRLWLKGPRNNTREYPVSTALKGAGQRFGSNQTPLGEHRIRLKIGSGCPPNTVFVGRRPTGELFDATLAEAAPGRDWILTRILWLTGRESGFNRGGEYDTLRRFIYIHGCPDSEPMGVPRSHGCIRMHNADLLDLYKRVRKGTLVTIEA